ncbi:MAG: trypsin-like peptidase domain-containing protein [Oscillospiraceae bacterium]|nr:trypsin-like peptidase domain-containing protein [Oscillospiraceae bacterium]
MKKRIAVLLSVACLLACAFPARAMTVLSSQKLSVDGKPIECEKYNIDGSNYFKLRDVAYLLNGTRAQFAVGWDAATQTVSILTKEAYSKNGTELDLSGGDKSATATPSRQTLQIDGRTVTGLSVYNIGGNNYFKLRDLGDALGFGVDYDEATRTAMIDSTGSSPVPQTGAKLTAKEIYQKCSPAVFYIEVYDAGGTPVSSGSGFFISSGGAAVTNYHVIDGAYSAKILRADNGAVSDVEGVYDYSEETDWAVLKVKGSGFPYLTAGSASTVVGGAAAYAIGSPKGLDNTISDGIISNPSRQIDGVTYIQTSAAISHGSSGGALLNEYGEVIGITSAGIESGENIGFALPISVVSGYRASSVTSLEELAKATTYTDQQIAAACLWDYIDKHANDTFADSPMYSETRYDTHGYTLYGIHYNAEYDELRLNARKTYDGVMASIIISLSEDSYQHLLSYFYYNEGSSSADFYGSAVMDASLFDGSGVTFTYVEGEASIGGQDMTAVHQSLAGSLLRGSTELANRVLALYGYSMSDFGFR